MKKIPHLSKIPARSFSNQSVPHKQRGDEYLSHGYQAKSERFSLNTWETIQSMAYIKTEVVGVF